MLTSGYITEYQDFIFQRVKKELGLGGMIRAATEVVIKFKPDLIVYITGWSKDDIPVELLNGFEEYGAKILTIAWDTYPGPTPLKFRQNNLYNSTSFFCEACSFISYARFRFWREHITPQKGVLYLSGNNILKNHFKKMQTKKNIDVALIGSLYKARIELLAFLKKNLSPRGINVSHFGGFFDETSGLPDNEKTHTLKRVSNEDYINIINRSKIVLCPGGAEGQWAVRGKIFEIISCGTFCLAEDNFDIQQTIPKENLATYKTFDECLNKIIFYLQHEDERQKFAVKSQKWFVQTYDSTKFWQNFFNNLQVGNYAFQNTPFVENNYNNFRNEILKYYDGQLITPKNIAGFGIDLI